MKLQKNLLIAARVNHYLYRGRFYSYTPYAREIDVWADLFQQVTIAGTLHESAPPGDCSPFTKENIRVIHIVEGGGDGFAAKFSQIFTLLKTVLQLARCLRDADAIHARCPCDLGMLSLLMGPLFTGELIAKYATQWLPYSGEPLAWRLQRLLLKSWWWKGPVTVYGKWPNQPAKVLPFFTSMLTDEQILDARAAAASPRCQDVFRILFVGRLSKSKNVDVLLRAISQINRKRRRVECVVIGEGPEGMNLEKLRDDLGLTHTVRFLGGLSFEDVLGWYSRSNVLVLASDIEGWPKAIAEGMAFGLVCIGTEKGMMPQMLGHGRGLLVPPRDPDALGQAIEYAASHPEEARRMSESAAAWAQQFSIDGLRKALREVIGNHWSSVRSRPNEMREALPK